MLHVDGANPLAALKYPRHHAKKFAPLALEIAAGLLLSEIGQDHRVHVLLQSRGGPGSYTLYLDGAQHPTATFSFKYDHSDLGDPLIVVTDRYQMGNVIFEIRTIEDVWAFIAMVEQTARAGQVAA